MLILSLLLAMAGAAELRREGDTICRPIPEADRAAEALNEFWGLDVLLCESDDPDDSAAALISQGVVLANRDWLGWVAQDYGAAAATGILAHEWAHIAHPELRGRSGELQADCMAGAFVRDADFDHRALDGFALISLHSGDGRRWRGHGTGRQRRAAVMRGYRAGGPRGPSLLTYCSTGIT